MLCSVRFSFKIVQHKHFFIKTIEQNDTLVFPVTSVSINWNQNQRLLSERALWQILESRLKSCVSFNSSSVRKLMGFVLIVAVALTFTFSTCDHAVWQNLEGRSLLVEKGGSNLKRPNPFPRYGRIAKQCNFSVQKKIYEMSTLQIVPNGSFV